MLFSWHIEDNIFAIQEVEIRTNSCEHKRMKEYDKPNFSLSCQVCHQSCKTMQHLLASCSGLSASMYLPVRHNAVAMQIYFELVKNIQLNHSKYGRIRKWQQCLNRQTITLTLFHYRYWSWARWKHPEKQIETYWFSNRRFINGFARFY